MKKLSEHLFIIGFMGVGKTSTSRALSKKLGVKELDTDAMIVEEQKMSISKIFRQKGEDTFRQIETNLLMELKKKPPCIISCGGGVAMRQENVKLMKESGKVLFLTATPQTIYERVKDSTNRPLLNGNMNLDYIRQLLEQRQPAYEKAADFLVSTDGLHPGQVADRVIASLNYAETAKK